MIEIIRVGLSGPISWYEGLGIALAVALVGLAVYLGTRTASREKPLIVYTLAPYLWLWLAMSVLWIVGVFYLESLDGLWGDELGEVFSTALVPVIVPPLVFATVGRIFAERSRP
jgi:hypothetical protein